MYDAHIHLTVLLLSDLFAKRKGIHSFPFLIKRCIDEGRISSTVAAACTQQLSNLVYERRAIGTLRGEHFGHKTLNVSIRDVLREAGLKIKHINDLLDASFWFLNALADSCDNKDYLSKREVAESAKESLQQALRLMQGDYDKLEPSEKVKRLNAPH